MSDEYTPTLDEIKGWYAGAVDEYRCDTGMSMDEAEVAFDRAIAAHDAKVQESILRKASAGFSHCRDYPYRASRWRATEDYLDDMADSIARGEDQTDE